MVGDFKVIRYPSEKLGCDRFTSSMQELSNVIMDLNLVDGTVYEEHPGKQDQVVRFYNYLYQET
jgi:hypothetical protein